ncbi:MAG: hypothetical protein ABSB59_39605 [Streptosporangiaceae bacterium]
MASIISTAGLIVLAVTGCGNGGSTSQVSTRATIPAATEHATSSPTSQPLPTGTKLNSLLLNKGSFPAGFSVIAANTRNTADSTSPDSPGPMPASQWCNRLTGTSWIAVGGIDSASWAQREYINSAKTETIGEESHCKSFSQTYSGMQARTTAVRSKLPGVGSQAIKLVETSPTFIGGTTLVAIRVGNAIVTTIYSSQHSDLGSPAVTWAERVAKRLPAS